AVAALSHHIKNILQGLRSGSDILRMGLSEKDDNLLQKGWNIVEKNQGKIYNLVMDMLSYSKEREPVVEPTDLNRLVRDVLALTQGRAKDWGARLESRLDDLPLIQVDPEGIHRALLNIVGNALDAVEDRKNGYVGIGTKLEADGNWVQVVVIDNGPGVPPQKQADIFRPFVSTKGAKGTGLGLAVSRKILREHGGDILLQAQLGRESKFPLRLPLKSPPSADAKQQTGGLPRVRPPEDEDD